MNSLTQCIILLACISLSTSVAILNCRCVNTIQSVPYHLIQEVSDLKPRPYCNKREVIVTMKNGKQHCLDPVTKFTQAVLIKKEIEKTSSTTSS